MRYLLSSGLLLVCQLALAQPDPFPRDPFPKVASSYLVQVNGELMWERQSGRRLPPASLTKLMTALLLVEQGQLQSTVTVSRAAQHETGSHIGIKEGERFRAEDLLAATLIASANDACHALADHAGGDEKRFVQLMNRRAGELGLRHTHFVNACGHDAPNHYSTTRDLALLARELLKHPEITLLTAKQEASIATLDGAHGYHFVSTNALIGRYEGAIGLKTGMTAKAGKCLVAYARRGEDEVLLVMLHGNDRWWDAADILDIAFAHAQNHNQNPS
ncbi:MAG TPA: D-alanyl-D-alanine carboxypeptidase family protein [Gallionellaceae bacterium]